MAAGGSLFGSLVLGLLVYGSGAFALLRFDLWQWAGTPISLSPRDTLAAPAAFYLLLTVTALFRRVGLRSLPRRQQSVGDAGEGYQRRPPPIGPIHGEVVVPKHPEPAPQGDPGEGPGTEADQECLTPGHC